MQELMYEKKRRLIEDYSELVSWMNTRTLPEEILRSQVADHIVFFPLKGIITERKNDVMRQFLSGIYALNMPVVFVININNHKTEILLGCERDRIETLQRLVVRILGCRCVDDHIDSHRLFEPAEYEFESVLVGDTTYKTEKEYNVLDLLLTEGFLGECSIVISASPLSRNMGVKLSDYYNDLCTELTALTSRQITSRDDKDSVSYAEENGVLKRFQKITEDYQKKYEKGVLEGLFMSSVKLFSNNKSINDLIAGAFISQTEDNEYPEALQQVFINDAKYCSDLYVSKRGISVNGKTIALPELSNFFTASELAFFTEPPTKDTLGFYNRVIPGFDVERDVNYGIMIGSTLKAGCEASRYYLPMSEINRNALVSGLVGAGKTNTIEHILIELSKENVPILVIEPVKTEYYELADAIVDLRVISVGSKNNGLQLNPFQPVSEKISLQKHVDSLYSAIMAAFEWVPPMPQIVEKVIYRVYNDNGYDVANDIRNPHDNWPTIEQAYWTIRTVVKEEKFDARLESDLIGCIGARFNSLRVGNKGRSLNVKKSMPLDCIFNQNCIIELEEIQDEEVRSFVMGLLLANLREYCMLRDTSHLGVSHCTVIEEAHTLLRKVDASSSASQAKGVKVFSEMIKTLRAKGESFIVVDQVPTELAEDVLKNTNLKIAHRTVAADDKAALGKTMNCTEEQESYMTVLNRGEAMVFSEGDYRPKLVKIPLAGYEKKRSREEILQASVVEQEKCSALYDLNPSCLYCGRDKCTGLKEMIKEIDSDIMDAWTEKASEFGDLEDFKDLCMDIAIYLKRDKKMKLLGCVIGCILNELDMSIQEKHELYRAFRKLKF